MDTIRDSTFKSVSNSESAEHGVSDGSISVDTECDSVFKFGEEASALCTRDG